MGYPISSAFIIAAGISTMASSVPGTIGMPYLATAFFAANLLPITSMDSGEGPTKAIPASVTFLANAAFSDKNPYPG